MNQTPMMRPFTGLDTKSWGGRRRLHVLALPSGRDTAMPRQSVAGRLAVVGPTSPTLVIEELHLVAEHQVATDERWWYEWDSLATIPFGAAR